MELYELPRWSSPLLRVPWVLVSVPRWPSLQLLDFPMDQGISVSPSCAASFSDPLCENSSFAMKAYPPLSLSCPSFCSPFTFSLSEDFLFFPIWVLSLSLQTAVSDLRPDSSSESLEFKQSLEWDPLSLLHSILQWYGWQEWKYLKDTSKLQQAQT